MEYYIQGNEEKASQIKAAFEKLGYEKVDVIHIGDYANKRLFFFTENGKVRSTLKDCGIVHIIKTHPDYQELELPVEPCFKVGDKIEATIYGIKRRVTIREVDKTNRCYFGTLEECIGFSEQDQWHLALKPHYDISNLQPFDKVLVRDSDNLKWTADLFSYIDDSFVCTGGIPCRQCIPYNNDTKHLLGTTDMCDEQYINW